MLMQFPLLDRFRALNFFLLLILNKSLLNDQNNMETTSIFRSYQANQL